MYLGRLMENQGKDFLLTEFSLQNDIQLNASCVATSCLLDQITVRMLFDTGASESYMSRSFYMANQSLHKIPRFCTSSKGIMAGSGQHVPVLCVIPVAVSISRPLFEIYTIVAEILGSY